MFEFVYQTQSHKTLTLCRDLTLLRPDKPCKWGKSTSLSVLLLLLLPLREGGGRGGGYHGGGGGVGARGTDAMHIYQAVDIDMVVLLCLAVVDILSRFATALQRVSCRFILCYRECK